MFKKYKKQLAIFGAVATLGFGGFNYVQHVAEAKALSREAKQIQEQNAVMIENLRKELEQAKAKVEVLEDIEKRKLNRMAAKIYKLEGKIRHGKS
jgi:chorismate mutase